MVERTGRTVREGLSATLKICLLVIGVPATLVRLWLLVSPPDHPWQLATAGASALAAQLVLLVLGLGWLWAAGHLLRDVATAFVRHDLASSSWSSRWALRLAALVLMLAAGIGAAVTSRDRPVAAQSVTASIRPAISGAPHGELVESTRNATDGERQGDEARGAELAVLGLGALIACGVIRRGRLLRRAAACTRRPGERLPAPSPDRGKLETLLGRIGEATVIDWIDGTNRLLWQSLRESPDHFGDLDVELIRAGPDGVELLLGHPVSEPPTGFVAVDGGSWWCLDPDLDLAELERRTDGCGRYLPGLVPVGEDGAATYLLNVCPGRRLTLSGPEGRVEKALATIVVALRTLPWADELAVELVGTPPPSGVEQCYQLSASSLEELDALSSGPPAAPRDRLERRWDRQPMVVSAVSPSQEIDALLRRCSPMAGVVSLGERGTDRLVLDSKGAWLDPIGLRLQLPTPSADQLDLVDLLLAGAAEPAAASSGRLHPDGATTRERTDGPGTCASGTSGPGTCASGTSGPGTCASGTSGPGTCAPKSQSRSVAGWDRAPTRSLGRPGSVEVGLLGGPPWLSGISAEQIPGKDRDRVVEVVAYLCLHGGAAGASEIRSAVFAREGAAGSVERTQNVLAASRAALGRSRAGSARLARASGDTFALSDEVGTDWDRFVTAIEAARGASPEVAADLLEQALGLVGPGTCGLGTAGYDWLAAEGIQEEMLATVVDSAHHLALLALARPDAGLARWAVGKGRLAEPCSEMLARDLMLACDVEGDRTGLVRTFETLELALARLGGNEPSTETRELYSALALPSSAQPSGQAEWPRGW